MDLEEFGIFCNDFRALWVLERKDSEFGRASGGSMFGINRIMDLKAVDFCKNLLSVKLSTRETA